MNRKGERRPRARDFFDIHSVLSKEEIHLTQPENLDLIRNIFAAKKVPLPLLAKIKDQRTFHEPDWPSVVETVAEDVRDFSFYFDFVVSEVENLKSLWEEDPPA